MRTHDSRKAACTAGSGATVEGPAGRDLTGESPVGRPIKGSMGRYVLVKRYVILLHYHKRRGNWTVHYRGECLEADAVQFNCWATTEIKPKGNPCAFIRAYGRLVPVGDRKYKVIW